MPYDRILSVSESDGDYKYLSDAVGVAAEGETTLIMVASSAVGGKVIVDNRDVVIAGAESGQPFEWATSFVDPPLTIQGGARVYVSNVRIFRSGTSGQEARPAVLAESSSRVYFDKSVIVGLNGVGIFADQSAVVRLWSTSVLGQEAGLETSESAKIEGAFLSVGATEGPARKCTDDKRVNLHNSIIFSDGGESDGCDSDNSSGVWDMNEGLPSSPAWFADFYAGDLHVGEVNMTHHQPDAFFDRLIDGPLCDMDGDVIPETDAYPGADQPQ
ncbi:hypothetical protein ENSA7_81750 [Enhygromyxa salina]|uniref:Uncharacterized protein n=1 Tax=Enhygromyxa salina TaxID=215803 RepID=A0A2S9XGW9_9BACT|nr:hypothetical protein ENSA7_81750 [Enhygromyxa salina]